MRGADGGRQRGPITALAVQDPLLAYAAPFVRQAADELPGALAALRERLPVGDGPVAVLGGSLGGAVALEVLTAQRTPVSAVALVNPAVRMRTLVGIVEGLLGQDYRWTPEADRTAEQMDFVARAAALTAAPPVLVVSGEQDHPASLTDAADLVDALRRGRAHPDVELVAVPGLVHALADEPGLEPASQRPTSAVVDEVLTRWFVRQLADA